MNEQRTVKYIQYGRLKYVISIGFDFFCYLSPFSYTPTDKQLIQYTNENSLKYPYTICYQQQFLSSHNLFNRPQTQRTSQSR